MPLKRAEIVFGDGTLLQAGSTIEVLSAEQIEQQLEARIEQIETRIAEIEAALGDPALYAAGTDPTRPAALAAERDTLTAELSEAYATWERVGEELAGV